jgi:hypothetical protein
MAVANCVAFQTPVVREMTSAEYREQRRRVAASLCEGRDGEARPGAGPAMQGQPQPS